MVVESRMGETGSAIVPILHAREYGSNDASPLLLLHGLGGGGSTWAQVAELLSSHRRVLVPDLLGFGRSPWPDAAYTVDDHLAALERLLEERGLATGQLDIAGHSRGRCTLYTPYTEPFRGPTIYEISKSHPDPGEDLLITRRGSPRVSWLGLLESSVGSNRIVIPSHLIGRL